MSDDIKKAIINCIGMVVTVAMICGTIAYINRNGLVWGNNNVIGSWPPPITSTFPR